MNEQIPELSVVLPCRNEEEALENCIHQITNVLEVNGVRAEIIVSDSSSDRSAEIARRHGIILVKHDKEGYGMAYLEGFKAACGKYIFCADPDGSYDFVEIPRFLEYLREGYDFVIGNRFKGRIAPNEGGYKETVIDGVTGRLIDDINPDKLVQAVKEIGKDPQRYKDACLKQAMKFDTTLFIAMIKEMIGA